MIAEDGITEIWLREGTESTQAALRRLSSLNCTQRYEDAIELAEQLIGETPCVAESHHQLASAYFMTDNFRATIIAAAQAVELNPYHFCAHFHDGQELPAAGTNHVGFRMLRTGATLESES